MPLNASAATKLSFSENECNVELLFMFFRVCGEYDEITTIHSVFSPCGYGWNVLFFLNVTWLELFDLCQICL